MRRICKTRKTEIVGESEITRGSKYIVYRHSNHLHAIHFDKYGAPKRVGKFELNEKLQDHKEDFKFNICIREKGQMVILSATGEDGDDLNVEEMTNLLPDSDLNCKVFK